MTKVLGGNFGAGQPQGLQNTSLFTTPTPGGWYNIGQGDTLWGVSKSAYGDGSLWPEIADANPDAVSPGGGIQVGKQLYIPKRGAADKLAGDAGADAKKIIDDGKPKGDGTLPEADPELQGDFNAARNQANIGGKPYTVTHDRTEGFLDERKDVTDEASSHKSKLGKGGASQKLLDKKWVDKDLGGKQRIYTRDKGWHDEKKDVADEAAGKKKLEKDVSANATIAATQIQVEGSVWKKEGETSIGGDAIKMKGQVHAIHGEALGSASVGVDLKKGTIKGDVSGRAEFHLVGAKGEIKSKEYGNGVIGGQTTVKGKAYIGAEATGNVTVNFDPRKGDVKVNAGVDLFAGGKASAEVKQSFKVGGHDVGSVGAKGEVYAGIGVKAKGEVGFEKGRFKASVELGAALGVGAGVKLNVDVDVVGTAKAVYDGGKKVVGAVADGAKAVGGAIADGASAVGRGIADGAKSVYNKLKFW